MRLTNVFSGRPAYYDRNPTAIGTMFYVADVIGPHAFINRVTYTVPSGRKAIVEGAFGSIVRTAAGGVVGLAEVVFLQVSGSGEASVTEFDNTVGAKANGSMAGGVLPAATQLIISTADASTTTSTHSFRAFQRITEFDV
jgi:hypothetical protein